MEVEIMYERFTDRARKVMQLANQEAQRFNHEWIGPEHILLGLVKEGSGVAATVLKNLDVDLRKIRLEVDKLVVSGTEIVTFAKLPQTPQAKKAIETAMEESRNLGHSHVGTGHLLLGLLGESEGIASNVLKCLNLRIEPVRDEILKVRRIKTPALDSFTRDLSAESKEENCPQIVNRNADLDVVEYALAKQHKNWVLLTGEDGVGKSAVIAGLARRIAKSEQGQLFHANRVLALNEEKVGLNSEQKEDILLEALSYDFETTLQSPFRQRMRQVAPDSKIESRLSAMANELGKVDDVILVLDNPGVIGLRMLQMLRSFNNAKCVVEIRRRHPILYSREFNDRIQIIDIEEPTMSGAVAMIQATARLLETRHDIEITDDACLATIEMSAHHDCCPLPGAAVALLDASVAAVAAKLSKTPQHLALMAKAIAKLEQLQAEQALNQEFEDAVKSREAAEELRTRQSEAKRIWAEESLPKMKVVNRAQVLATSCLRTGLPSAWFEDLPTGQRFAADVEDSIRGCFPDQLEAVKCVGRVSRRILTALRGFERPIATILFVGPRGTGKNRMASQLGVELFGMRTTFRREASIGDKVLVGGHSLSEQFWRDESNFAITNESKLQHPFGVVVFEAPEHSDKTWQHQLVSKLNDARRPKSMLRGKLIIVIMHQDTRNYLASKYGERADHLEEKGSNDKVERHTELLVIPELRSHLDDIAIFGSRPQKFIENLLSIEFQQVKLRMRAKGADIESTPEAWQFLCDLTHNEGFSAQRVIERYLETAIVDYFATNDSKIQPFMMVELVTDRNGVNRIGVTSATVGEKG